MKEIENDTEHMVLTCPKCDGQLNELSVDGPPGTTVFNEVMKLTASKTLRIQAVCEACDEVVEREVTIDPYREIKNWTDNQDRHSGSS
ncbi:hypothetical protein N0B31_10270 [Salinirubellus salinus]|uniref:Uncharacterized protein n=1 Tax=Salinirubellus salinus TaxID=1364945 RepID=A0A9E7R678_9EURY|nr:hypothetical protein [Salinirubellus salinus]UWM56660.1 hypothetical protein N0B31_10270 [Salinirubellus salinus]